MGSLSGCILENDAEAQERGRLLRGKSLAVSVALETAVLVALLIWPMIHPDVLNGQFLVTPVPPYSGHHGANENKPGAANHLAPARNEAQRLCLMCAQPAAPVQPRTGSSERDETLGNAPSLGDGPDVPGAGSGPIVPGGNGENPLNMEIKKPEAPRRPGLERMSEGVLEAALIRRVQPEYPRLALAARISGVVQLRAIVGTDGRIRQLEVVSGAPLLQAAAVAAVREWRYRPTLLNGEAVEVETLITVNFVLDGSQ